MAKVTREVQRTQCTSCKLADKRKMRQGETYCVKLDGTTKGPRIRNGQCQERVPRMERGSGISGPIWGAAVSQVIYDDIAEEMRTRREKDAEDD